MHLKHKVATVILAALAMAASSAAGAAPRPTHAMHAGHAHRDTNEGMIASPDCDPFADWDDQTHYLLSGAPQSPFMRPMSRMDIGSGSAAQVIGTTPEAIHRNFLKVVTQNLANAGTATRIERLSDRELAAIARHAAQGAPAERTGLLKLFALRLDGRSLVRIARAFGRAPTEAAVHAYAGRATRDAFDGQVAGFMAPPPEGGGGSGGTSYPPPSPPRPTIDMTLREIYLEYRTAPIGSLSPSASLAETSMFAGRYLSPAAGTGVFIGTVIHELITEFAPSLDDTIGGTIAGMIDDFWEASGQAEEGHFEAAFDSLFGFPVSGSSDPWGDWDISSPMMFYYQSSGTCGW